MPLASSFWVDEMATRFVVTHGESDPSLRIAPQVASVYYTLPKTAASALSFSQEVTYRIPSVLAMIAALFLIGRLAARLVHPSAAWFAIFVCLTLKGINYEAADARPYALGTLALTASLLFLVRWFDFAEWYDGILFVLSAALVWRVHLIFWPVYLVFAAYAIYRLRNGKTAADWINTGVLFALVGFSLIPVLLDARALMREAADHVVAPKPSLTDLSSSLKTAFLASIFTGITLLSRWRRWPRVAGVGGGAVLLAAGWWLCQPLGLYAFSWISGNSAFVPRYLFLSLPGVALMATVIVALYLPAKLWKQASLMTGLAALVFMGQWNRLWPAHHNSDWRAAAAAVNALATGPDVPVICPSAFIEARTPVWRPDYPVNSFLYSHLLAYGIHGSVHPFPYDDSPEAQTAAVAVANRTLVKARRFVIYGSERSAKFWRNWFRARPELAGWRDRSVGPFGDVDVVLFEAGPLATSPLRVAEAPAPSREVGNAQGRRSASSDSTPSTLSASTEH